MTQTTYPDAPGFKVAGTSESAAVAAQSRTETLRGACLTQLLQADLTADECARELNESVLSIRPRFSELRRRGMIRKSGERRLNDSGCSAWVWTVKQPES